jgi:hypothetical protein
MQSTVGEKSYSLDEVMKEFEWQSKYKILLIKT